MAGRWWRNRRCGAKTRNAVPRRGSGTRRSVQEPRRHVHWSQDEGWSCSVGQGRPRRSVALWTPETRSKYMSAVVIVRWEGCGG